MKRTKQLNKQLKNIQKSLKKDASALGLYDYQTINPRATHVVDQMISFIQTLIDKGAAYVSSGDVYFDVNYDKEYGKLSGKKD